MKYAISFLVNGEKMFYTGGGFTNVEADAWSFFSQRLANEKINDARRLFTKLMDGKTISETEVVSVADVYIDNTIEEKEEEIVNKVETSCHVEEEEEQDEEINAWEYADQTFSDPARGMALYEWLKDNGNELSIDELNDCGEEDFDWGRCSYMVLTDDEADEKAAQYIKDSLWAFNAEFLENYTPVSAKTIRLMQESCEDCNDELLDMVGAEIDDLIGFAIRSDGRGSFLNTYDGRESEFEHNGETYYIYRTS